MRTTIHPFDKSVFSLSGSYALLCLLLFAAPAQSSENIGRVLSSVGDFAALQPDNVTRPLKRRSPVLQQDTLSTGDDAYGQVRFSDGGLLELQANSQFRVEEYRFDKDKPGAESATFSLIKGAMRTVTGAIGKRNKEAYSLKTAVATIGLRGTHWGIRLCGEGECRDSNGNPIHSGLYGQVTEGAVIVKTNAGEKVFKAGEFFYVPGPDQLPMLLEGQQWSYLITSGNIAEGVQRVTEQYPGLPGVPWEGPDVEPEYRSTDQTDGIGLTPNYDAQNPFAN
ncbi:MAG: FecR family protein [Sedimenticola sp.]